MQRKLSHHRTALLRTHTATLWILAWFVSPKLISRLVLTAAESVRYVSSQHLRLLAVSLEIGE